MVRRKRHTEEQIIRILTEADAGLKPKEVCRKYGIGYGYSLACFLGLAATVFFLNQRLRLLHFWTFMRQPVPRPIVVHEEGAEVEEIDLQPGYF